MKKVILAVPSVLASLIAASPVLTCPACWPLYAGLLSSMGIGFVNYTKYIFPVTIFMLVISLVSFWWKAENRRGYAPLIVGIIASIALVAGKFYIDDNYLFYTGAMGLVIASIWNVWPVQGKCKTCEV